MIDIAITVPKIASWRLFNLKIKKRALLFAILQFIQKNFVLLYEILHSQKGWSLRALPALS